MMKFLPNSLYYFVFLLKKYKVIILYQSLTNISNQFILIDQIISKILKNHSFFQDYSKFLFNLCINLSFLTYCFL